MLVSNEIVGARNTILRQNIMKWGNENVIVTQNEPSDFDRLEGFFDIVLVDAPCSGEGLFRKNLDARDEWSEENIQRCSVRQQEILKYAFSTLRPGGFLIYSTCTFEEEENDNQIKLLLDTFGFEFLNIDHNFPNISKTKLGLVFYPHLIRGEGFYISLLQKKDGDIFHVKKADEKYDSSLNNNLTRFLKNSEKYSALLKEDRLFAIPQHFQSVFNTLNKNLYIRLAGIYMGDFKGEDFIPSAALALSNQLRDDLPSKALSEKEAIDYLKGGNLNLDVSKGWSLVTFKKFKLGWIKNIGSRINNYYPKEWRIKK